MLQAGRILASRSFPVSTFLNASGTSMSVCVLLCLCLWAWKVDFVRMLTMRTPIHHHTNK